MVHKLKARTLLLALALLAVSCGDPSPKRGIDAISRTDDIGTKMRHFADQAVLDASKHYHLELDYSPESVRSIEEILAQLSQSSNFKRYSDKDIRAEALIYGAYIGEVIRRQHGGAWAENHSRAGEGSYPLNWKEQSSFPYIWCYKRLVGDQTENVWHKYQYFVMKSVDPNVEIEVIKHDSAGLPTP